LHSISFKAFQKKNTIDRKNYEISFCFFDLLPNEMVVTILHFLDWKTLLTASQVCKLWYQECRREELWYQLCKQILGDEINTEITQFIKEKEKLVMDHEIKTDRIQRK